MLQRQGIRKAVLVDEVISEIEQVAFPPPWNLRGMPYLAGVIVMGTGTLVPVIEARDLMQKASATRLAAPAEMAVPAARRQSVMVVDDSPTILALHRSILKNAGFEVIVAEDGNAAWKALQLQDVDLLLTDIEMPGMNGLELIRKVRASATRRHMPVIVISQYGSREDLQKGAGAGADRYIVKSAFDPQKLLEMIHELLME
jgi:CheY-like chemotaxis protein